MRHSNRFLGFVALLLSFVFFFGDGCSTDLLSEALAQSGLASPRLSLTSSNVTVLLRRILWMERLQSIEKKQIQPHALSLYLGTPVLSARGCDQTTQYSCFSCLDGSEKEGKIHLPCWTNQAFEGLLEINVVENQNDSGQGTTYWDQVCGKTKEKREGLLASYSFCAVGTTGYNVITNNEQLDYKTLNNIRNRATRTDLLYLVGLKIQPERTGSYFSLKGAMGFSFEQDKAPPTQEKKAIFLQEASIHYKSFEALEKEAKVLVNGKNGTFQCSFSWDLNQGKCLNPDTLESVEWTP